MNPPTYTVLLVEDFAADRELYRRSLCQDSTCRYELLEAESVAAGLELCQTRSIDAILLDYILPDGDGLDFLAELSVQSNGRMPPVVMMTGMGNESIAVRAIKLGAEDYLVKRDLTPDLLQLKVRRAIENVRLRQQQQQQEQRFRASVENLLDCFGIYSAIRDASGQIVDFRFDYQNAAGMQGLRMTAADMAKTMCEVFPAARESGMVAEYARVVETGIPLVKDDLVYSDVFGGEQLTRAYNVQAVKLDDGFMASWRDITAQKQLELSLTAANQQITTIWESMTDAYVTLDLDWRVVYTNPAAIEVYRQTTGLTPAEYLGKSHWEVFPATVGTIVEREYRRAVTDRVAVHFELFYDPTETWFEIHAYPSTEGLGIYFRDINQRKQSELARLAAEQERDRFFNLSIDLLIVANFDGYFVGVNPACEPMLGFTSAEMMAQPFLDFVHPDDLAATMAVVESLDAGNVLVNFENRYRCKDGSYRWILWSATPDVERNLLYANGHDITEQKQVQLNDRFLYELTQRLRHLTTVEEIQWEAVKSLGEYLDVDRSMWYEVGEPLLAKVSRDWCREGIGSIVGDYPLNEFLSPAFLAAMLAGEPMAISDVTADPLTAAYRDNYQQVGIRAFANIPCLDDEGRWVMTLHLNTAQNVRIWRNDEIQLMQTLVTQLWSFVAQARAVAALRAQEHQTRAAQAIVEQKLREIETIYQTAPVGLCFVDTDLRFVRLNEQLAQINGLPVSAHIGCTLREVLPEMADMLEPLYRQVIESGEPILDLEVSGMNAAQPGVERHWIVCYYPQTDAEGRTIGVNVMVQEITDRKLAEAALRASERMRRFMFDQTFELMGLVDLDGVLLEVNQAALDSISAQSDEIVGRKFWETPWWHTPQLQQQLVDAIDRAAKGEVIRYEVQFLDGNGNAMMTDFSLKPMFDEDGRIVKLIGEGRDITDRKLAERRLQESEQRLRTGVEVAGVGLARFDYATNLVELSPEAAALYGFAPETSTITRAQIHDTFHPDEREELEDVIAQVLDPDGMGWFAQDHRVVWPSGEVRCLSVRKQVFFDRSGVVARPSYAILAAIDVTDRKQAEQHLRESEQRLRTGVEVAGVGLARFDYATNLVELSPEAAALYGFAPEISTITREQIHNTFHPDERAELEAVIAQVIDPQGTGWFAQDHRVVWPSGEVRCLSVRKRVFFDRSSVVARPSYAILAAIDITDRQQTQADLEERNRELDSFVFVVSHDLKAPLRAVSHLSQWIEDDLEGQLTPDNQSQMNLLRSRINRMSATIDGLLEYARCGRSEDPIESVSIAELLAEVIDSVAPPPTFTIDLPADLPTLSTKRLPLFQVLTNLVGNGIRHHHSEAGSIQISIEERGNFYEFAIADDGPGIALENQQRMFKIFQAVNPQNRSDSTGIGLAIVKKIIEAEGGTIRLESEIGKGTTFYFTWPKRSGDPRT